MKLNPHYSGKKSKKFWDSICSHKGIKFELLYTLGCCLQDLEVRVLGVVNKGRKK